jgi:hypothetical protein
MGQFNSGGETVRFSVSRSINDNSNSPYGGPSADFTVHAREWHSGQECATVYYSEHGSGSGTGGYYISHAGPRDQQGNGYWFYMRLEGGIRYIIRKYNNTGYIGNFSTTATSDPGGVTAIQGAGFSLLGNVNEFYSGTNRVLNASNYSSYALPLSGGAISGPITSYYTATLPIFNGNWAGSNYWGIGSTGATHVVRIGEIAGNTWASQSSDITLQIGSNTALHSGNYSSYALPTSGGTVGGDLTVTGTLRAYSNAVRMNRINWVSTGDSQYSDPYCFRWRGENDGDTGSLSWLELQMNDDPNEEFRIYGYSCSGYGCGQISGNLYHRFDASGNAWHSGNVTAYSDIRVKENISTIDNAVDKVMQIRGVTFTRNDKADTDTRHAGVIAQEVEAVLPEVVDTDEFGMKSVAYGNMVGLLIEAIKEQQKQIEELKGIINEIRR